MDLRALNVDLLIINLLRILIINIGPFAKHIRILLHAEFLVELITITLALVFAGARRVSVVVALGNLAGELLVDAIPPLIQCNFLLLLKLCLIT